MNINKNSLLGRKQVTGLSNFIEKREIEKKEWEQKLLQHLQSQTLEDCIKDMGRRILINNRVKHIKNDIDRAHDIIERNGVMAFL
jgi:ribosomal protein S24E